MLTPSRIYRGLLFLIPLLAPILGCSPKGTQEQKLRSQAGAADIKPDRPETIEAQLQRYIGQTNFLNIETKLGAWEQAEAEVEAPADEAGKRDIQEADLFKIGKPGSRLLYLLNPYRGLQVVDFSKGAESPQLLGRAAATGNDVLEMYFNADHMQIIVLERLWETQADKGVEGRLAIYSVQDPSRPTLVQTHALNGDIADSRLLGDVLYVATSRWNYYQGGTNPLGEGWISAFKLTETGLNQLASHQLSLPVSSLKNLNIVETQEAGLRRYYLISVLDENRFGWRDRQSTVEVVDISDPQGSIQPLLISSVQGELRERSSTQIKDRTLITVSNSWKDTPDGNQLLQVTVESFKFPEADAIIIDKSEADFRRLWFEREMKNKPLDIDPLIYAEKLQNDPNYGLKGIFIRQDKGGLAKLIPEQAISVGDDTGQHADLQDVRFVGDKLYVFWVPANQIDPLDVFDISQAGDQLRYLGRTLFEGWIERAIPLQFEGRDYILGLGWTAGTEASQRKAQAILFGLDSGNFRPLAQLTLANDEVWSYFNDEDKFIDVKTREDGSGTIIFPAFSYKDGQALSGGKLLAYNLKGSSPAEMLQEGALLAADSDWLRRVFSNAEIDKVHTLTDRSLSTFNLESRAIGAADQVIEALSILELARDIVAYSNVTIGEQNFGVQIIEKGSQRSKLTSVRLTNVAWADAELNSIRLQKTLKGQYAGHLLGSDGTLFVLTSRSLDPPEGVYDAWTNEMRLTRLKWLANGEIAINSQSHAVIWTEKGTYDRFRSSISPYELAVPSSLFELNSGEIVVAQGRNIKFFSSQEKLQVKEVANPLACLPAEAEALRYHDLSEETYISYALPVASDAEIYSNARLLRHFMSPLSAAALNCQASINIPGRPLRLQNGRLITEEQRLLGFDRREINPASTSHESAPANPLTALFSAEMDAWPQTGRVLTSLRLENGLASLRDLYSLEATRSEVFMNQDKLVLLEQAQQWGPRYIVQLQLAEAHDDRFTRSSTLLPSIPSEDLRLLQVLAPTVDSQPLFLVQSARQGMIMYEEAGFLKPMQLIIVKSPDERSEPVSSFPLFDWFESGYRTAERLVFDPQANRLSFAQGLWGVQQVELIKPIRSSL